MTLSKTRRSFADYRRDAATWITLATGEYYPDILPEACELYKPVLVLFGQIVKRSESSAALFRNICEVTETWMRIQLARVFRKYVSPALSVEMLKKKSQAEEICDKFGREFRPDLLTVDAHLVCATDTGVQIHVRDVLRPRHD